MLNENHDNVRRIILYNKIHLPPGRECWAETKKKYVWKFNIGCPQFKLPILNMCIQQSFNFREKVIPQKKFLLFENHRYNGYIINLLYRCHIQGVFKFMQKILRGDSWAKMKERGLSYTYFFFQNLFSSSYSPLNFYKKIVFINFLYFNFRTS